ncbi:MAG: DNA methyltransferase [Nitrososphaerota archaeon]
MEFASKLEEIMPAEELLLEPTPSFGKYGMIMPKESIAHPAKFNTNLVELLIKRYTKPGDVVLDPMAGTGVLGVVAALHGRHAIQVEIEERFFNWMERARENVEKALTLTPKGKIVNVHGDARRLSELLSQVDVVLTSPPYGECLTKRRKGYTVVPGLEKTREMPQDTRDDNIANLPHGSIDAIITSPPFGDTNLSGGDPERRRQRLIEAGHDPRDFLGGRARNAVLKHYGEGSGSSTMNIGRLPLGNVDAIITSPPYKGSLEGTSRHTRGGIASRDPALARTGTYAIVDGDGQLSPENIGNLKSSDEEYEALARGLMTKDGRPTYLSEMLKVYRECWKVLKPGGLAIVVVKPFVRNKKVVDLPYHTYLLLSRCGFSLEKLYKLRLKRRSFWRTLYYRKHPDVPEVNHEWVLVCRKPLEGG